MSAAIPRRSQLDKMSLGEHAIRDAVRLVEGMGADARLTDAVVLLQAARESVADFIDGVEQRRYVTDTQLPKLRKGRNPSVRELAASTRKE